MHATFGQLLPGYAQCSHDATGATDLRLWYALGFGQQLWYVAWLVDQPQVRFSLAAT